MGIQRKILASDIRSTVALLAAILDSIVSICCLVALILFFILLYVFDFTGALCFKDRRLIIVNSLKLEKIKSGRTL